MIVNSTVDSVHQHHGCTGQGLRLDDANVTSLSAVSERLAIDTGTLIYDDGIPQSFTVHVFGFRATTYGGELDRIHRRKESSMSDQLPGSRQIEPRATSFTFTVFDEGQSSFGDRMKRVDIRYASPITFEYACM